MKLVCSALADRVEEPHPRVLRRLIYGDGLDFLDRFHVDSLAV